MLVTNQHQLIKSPLLCLYLRGFKAQILQYQLIHISKEAKDGRSANKFRKPQMRKLADLPNLLDLRTFVAICGLRFLELIIFWDLRTQLCYKFKSSANLQNMIFLIKDIGFKLYEKIFYRTCLRPNFNWICNEMAAKGSNFLQISRFAICGYEDQRHLRICNFRINHKKFQI